MWFHLDHTFFCRCHLATIIFQVQFNGALGLGGATSQL